MSLHRHGRRLSSNELVELGDEDRCSHPGCEVVVSVIVPHPDGFAGQLTYEHTTDHGNDMHYRSRCREHAEHPVVEGQLGLFGDAA